MSDELQIKIAQPDDFEKIGEVFNLYRQFYEKESNIEACKNYIHERLINNEAQIFYIENEKECMGITQLYMTFDSLELSKKIILYDLYVRSEYRNKGIGRMLMNAAKSFAEKKGVTSIELSTSINNKNAQSLYESLEYQRDTEFYDYYLAIK
ncbi:GNAT family N-acetyltransferase [Pelagibacteraceae bacterium]|nr:GNAT family N-acetyltransferase [Pelagibacteraceae bacterium]